MNTPTLLFRCLTLVTFAIALASCHKKTVQTTVAAADNIESGPIIAENQNIPVVTISSPVGSARISAVVQVQGKVTGKTAITKIEFYVDGKLLNSTAQSPFQFSFDTSSVSVGGHNLMVKGYDQNGLAGSSTVIVGVADLVPPTAPQKLTFSAIAATSLQLNWMASTDNVGVTGYFVDVATDAGMTKFLTGYQAKDAGNTPSLAVSGLTAATTYYFRVRAVDQAGNVSANSAVTPGMTLDNIPPSVTLSAPTNNAKVSGTIQVKGTATDNVGVTKIEFYLDTTLQTSVTASPFTFSLNTSTVAPGSHTLNVKAYDAANNVGTSSVTVTVLDTTAPTVTITGPAANANVSGTIQVQGKTSDNVGVTKVEVYVDATLGSSTTTNTAAYSFSLPTAGISGSHTLTVKAYDAAGNVGSNFVKVNVLDVAAPTVTISSPAADANVSGTVQVQGTAADNVGVSKLEIYVDSNLGSSTASVSSPYNFSLPTAGITGVHTFTVKAYDAAGNVGSTFVKVNVLDVAAPVVTISSPANGATITSSFQVQGTTSDNVGVTKTEVYIDTTLGASSSGTSPYSLSVNSAATNGAHTITVKGYDAAGNVGSKSVSVTVANSGSNQPPPPSNNGRPCGFLHAGETPLLLGQSISSCGGKYHLDFQIMDGNLVLYRTSDQHAIWATGTSNQGASSLLMQTDGNLVLSGNSNGIWSSSTFGHDGAYLAIQDDGNLVVYQGTNPLWFTIFSPYLSCDNGICLCGNFNPQGITNGASPDQVINGCITHTPNSWTMQLPATTYVVGHQIKITHPMVLTTAGLSNPAVPCFNAPGNGGAQDGLTSNVNCAQIYAADNSIMDWGGILRVGNQIGTTPVQNYPQPTFSNISNVIVDHIVIHGNNANRSSVQPIKLPPAIFEQLNVVYVQCANCAFNNGGNWYSLAGGISAQFADGFTADHNMFAFHGNLQEGVSAANPNATPRHAECLQVAGSGAGARLTNNFLRQCTDQGISFDGFGGFPTNGVPLYSFNNARIQGNRLFARDKQYMSAGIHINPTNNSFFTGTIVSNNQIDCADPANPNDAQCTMGILIGANIFSANDSVAASLYSGAGANGLSVNQNLINGPSVGVLVQYNPVPNNFVFVGQNNVTVTNDNYNNVPGFFLPMSCKQYQGRTLATDPCCRATPGSNWYQTPVAYPAPNVNQTISLNRDTATNPIISTPYMIDPVDASTLGIDVTGYQAFWRGGAELSCY